MNTQQNQAKFHGIIAKRIYLGNPGFSGYEDAAKDCNEYLNKVVEFELSELKDKYNSLVSLQEATRAVNHLSGLENKALTEKYEKLKESYALLLDLYTNEKLPSLTVEIPIEPHFAGDYRIEYDGKYVTLFGKDRRYKGFKFNEEDEDWFEEMVLVPCVTEARGISPYIESVTDDKVTIKLVAGLKEQ